MNNKKSIPFEKQLLKYLLVATLVPAILLLITLWYYQASSNLMVLIFLFLFCLTGYCATTLFQKITYQFRTLSNLLEGMTSGDYSLRGRKNDGDSALGQLVTQINALADTLMSQRFVALESQLLVAKVIQHIDVAIIAVNDQHKIALLNPAAESLLGVKQAEVMSENIAKLGCEHLLDTKNHQVLELDFAKGKGKFQITRDQYREHGHQHDLFFITDVHGLLREHERQAWQNLIRVLSHEINNSLAPISSFANTLQSISRKQTLESDFAENLHSGLSVISERANSLKQFIESYRQLSHLPEPKKRLITLSTILGNVTPLFAQRTLQVTLDEDVDIAVDSVQLEQVFINLFKNADEAMQDKAGVISLLARKQGNRYLIEILDQGNGIQSIDNLFTPFYTTKKQGSGIGLVLCRQIIEAHNGYLTLANRSDQQGVKVSIELPLANIA